MAVVGTAATAITALWQSGSDGARQICAVVALAPLPDMTTDALVAQVHGIDPDLPILILATAEEIDRSADTFEALDLFAVLALPHPPIVLRTALRAAARHHVAARAERDLLHDTLPGIVDVLVETLAVASPIAYSRTSRVRLLMERVMVRLGLQNDWQLEVAAMVSQIGGFAVPHSVLAKVEDTVRLTAVERQMYVGSLALASHLLDRIPRLGEVAAWVGEQVVDFSDLRPGRPGSRPRACFDAVAAFLAGYDDGLAPGEIVRRMTATGRYPTEVVDAVREAADVLTPKGIPESLPVEQVHEGMVLRQDVTTDAGLLLIRRGERVTGVIEQRLRNFAHSVGVSEPIAVLLPGKRPPGGRAARLRSRPAGASAASPETRA